MPETPSSDRPPLPRIRAARPEDATGISVLSRLLALDGHASDPNYQASPDPERPARIRRSLSVSPRACWVADDAGLVGFVWVRPLERTVAVQELYVMPDYRRLGVGRALVGAVLRAYDGTALTVGTLAQDERAVGFWRALGFAPFWMTLQRPGR